MSFWEIINPWFFEQTWLRHPSLLQAQGFRDITMDASTMLMTTGAAVLATHWCVFGFDARHLLSFTLPISFWRFLVADYLLFFLLETTVGLSGSGFMWFAPTVTFARSDVHSPSCSLRRVAWITRPRQVQ
eukprot:s219_g47.t1